MQKRNGGNRKLKSTIVTALVTSVFSYSLLRSIPACFATASNPFFSIVLKALVDNLSLTNFLPASHQSFLRWRLTHCNFFVLCFEKEIRFALFDFFPVKGHTLLATGLKQGLGWVEMGFFMERCWGVEILRPLNWDVRKPSSDDGFVLRDHEVEIWDLWKRTLVGLLNNIADDAAIFLSAFSLHPA